MSADQSDAQVGARARTLDEQDFVRRLWAKDASLWSTDEVVREKIRNRLGWLDVVESMVDELRSGPGIGAEAQVDDVEHLVLLGMGGSSLCPEVCAEVFGIEHFFVLDSTVPGAVEAVANRIDPARTLFIVSSKSGTTTETRAFADYFFGLTAPVLAEPGERFVAITDPGTPLGQLAHERDFGRLWVNPPDIGGRYSALSYFGLVPMALMGLDVGAILESAGRMARACGPDVPAADNPGVLLGIALAQAHQEGRDKITFMISPRLAAFGDWVEQLIAESSGKEGIGLVPVRGEPLGEAGAYGDDRLFVSMRLTEEDDAAMETRLQELGAAGHPVLRINLADASDVGGEFFRWEIAVAAACSLMGVNPFDEPNVSESKERTGDLLATFELEGALPEPEPVLEHGALSLFADLQGDAELAQRVGEGSTPEAWLRAHLERAQPSDYLAVLAFLAPDDGIERSLADLRRQVRDSLRVATTFGWGPRFLHSTGQLHKGGSERGLFLQLTADDVSDIDCPARKYSFGVLARAQALGDLQALQARGRRVLRVHLGGDPKQAVEELVSAVTTALS